MQQSAVILGLITGVNTMPLMRPFLFLYQYRPPVSVRGNDNQYEPT